MIEDVRLDATEEISSPEILEAMLRMMEPGQEPGKVRPQDVLHAGDDEVPAPIVAATLKSAGYVIVYDRESGEPSLCNVNMLPAQLRKRNDEGKLAFTWKKPAKPPTRGKTRCMLHPERRESWMDEMGLPLCKKRGYLPNEYQAEQHLRHRHNTEWKALEARREQEKRAEDRAAQQAMLTLLSRSVAASPSGGATPTISTPAAMQDAPTAYAPQPSRAADQPKRHRVPMSEEVKQKLRDGARARQAMKAMAPTE